MRDYPCPHCGGSGQVFIDRLEAAGCPVDLTHACAYCEGRGHFTRPVLPRGAVRAFAVGFWNEAEHDLYIEHATSAAKAKMAAIRDLAGYAGHTVAETMGSYVISVRRAPEHDEVQP